MPPCRLSLSLLAACLLFVSACDREPPLPPVKPGTTTLPAPPLSMSKPAEKPAIKPPHGGTLVAMPDGRGYVEWVVDAGRLYFLDASGGPLKGAEHVVLTVQTPAGPQQVTLTPCDDTEFAGACWTAPGGELRKKAPEAIVRFQLDGQPVRVVLSDEGGPANNENTAMPPAELPPDR